jgi:2-polyprenyl-3-methyl-5-hydroxy-6-metoxy-1,4-benzoquinol methylase
MINRLRELISQRRNRETLYNKAAFWDAKAEAYEDSAVSMWPNKSLNQLYDVEQKQLISHCIGPTHGYSVLDLGCGTGRFSRWFASQGARVTGIDFSAKALSIAENQPTENKPEYRRSSVFQLEETDSFDIVFVWCVLTMACRDKEQLLDALIRIRNALRANGRLLITEPIHQGFLHRVLDMDLPEFLAVMREAGFDVKVVTPLHFWPMRLVLAYMPLPGWLTIPCYHFGQALMKIPGFSGLGDYWAILSLPLSDDADNNRNREL